MSKKTFISGFTWWNFPSIPENLHCKLQRVMFVDLDPKSSYVSTLGIMGGNRILNLIAPNRAQLPDDLENLSYKVLFCGPGIKIKISVCILQK